VNLHTRSPLPPVGGLSWSRAAPHGEDTVAHNLDPNA